MSDHRVRGPKTKGVRDKSEGEWKKWNVMVNALGARGGVPSWYITSTSQGNG